MKRFEHRFDRFNCLPCHFSVIEKSERARRELEAHARFGSINLVLCRGKKRKARVAVTQTSVFVDSAIFSRQWEEGNSLFGKKYPDQRALRPERVILGFEIYSVNFPPTNLPRKIR